MATVIPVMGPGSADEHLDRCPPTFHFKLTDAELMDAVRAPEAAAQRLGLPTGVRSINVRYVATDPRTSDMPPGWCCMFFDGQWFCSKCAA